MAPTVQLFCMFFNTYNTKRDGDENNIFSDLSQQEM